MTGTEAFEESCENCASLAPDDTCANPQSVYFSRPTVYRDGDEVLQTGWCDQWSASADWSDQDSSGP
ncbi:MAG TPA: hypothetical protein VKX16_09765 [Chloroflexota bacterium]|nr:hypothetical protein [Chloroflexota bacterium]